MRTSFLVSLLVAVFTLQGCSVIVGTVNTDLNRQRRTAARTTGPDAPANPPAPGDRLALTLTTGRKTSGRFAAFRSDSLVLDGGRTLALADIQRVERPWTRVVDRKTRRIALALDLTVIGVILYLFQQGGFST